MGEAKDAVDRVWDAIESGDLDALDAVTAADVESRGPGWSTDTLEDEKAMLRAWMEAFPDLRHQVVSWAEAGDTVTLELTITGTHTGTLRTPAGDVPPTGRSVTINSCDYIVVRAGKVASWHAYFDQFTFLDQLGLVPAPVPA